jgi:hypothetical protein
MGTCDCGNPNFWNSVGFCSSHSGLSQDHQIDTDFSDSVSAFSHESFSILNSDNFQEIISVLSQIISLGDARERCVVSGISKHINDLIQKIIHFSFEFSSNLFTIFLN